MTIAYSMLPQMDNFAVGVCHVAGLNSGWATSHIFRVHNHRGLAHAAHCRGIRGVAFGVGRRIAIEGCRSFAVNNRARDRATGLNDILAGLKALVDGRAALRALRPGTRSSP